MYQAASERARRKGGKVETSSLLFLHKKEHEAFNAAWAAAERRGDVGIDVWGESGEIDTEGE